jgi:hypothetical protein
MLEPRDIEAGDSLEMARVERGDIEAGMKCCRTDHQVLDCDGDALCRLLALDASGNLGDLQCQGIYDQIVEDTLHENAPSDAVGIRFGPVDPVRQLYGTNGGERDVGLAMGGANAAENVFDTLAAPLAFDQDAGIEDQAQCVSPMPTCREASGCE